MVRKLTQTSEEHTAIMCRSQDADQGLINSEVCLILADQLTPYLCSAKNFKFVVSQTTFMEKKTTANQTFYSLCTLNASPFLCFCSISSFYSEPQFLRTGVQILLILLDSDLMLLSP